MGIGGFIFEDIDLDSRLRILAEDRLDTLFRSACWKGWCDHCFLHCLKATATRAEKLGASPSYVWHNLSKNRTALHPHVFNNNFQRTASVLLLTASSFNAERSLHTKLLR